MTALSTLFAIAQRKYAKIMNPDLQRRRSYVDCKTCVPVRSFASTRDNLELTLDGRWNCSLRTTDVIASADFCVLCRYLRKLSLSAPDGGAYASKATFLEVEVGCTDEFWICVNRGNDVAYGVEHIMRWSLYAEPDNPAAVHIRHSPVNRDVRNSASQARAWIDECTSHALSSQLLTANRVLGTGPDGPPVCVSHEECTSHESCGQNSIPLLPTRVLDVDSQHGARLYVARYGERAQYVALSYCWGGPQSIQTLKSSLERYQIGIDIQDLPQTLQDAVYFTRELGVKYLWIDSLCIIQDSQEDKDREIAQMAGVYRNALVTIAAASASSCTDGFLQPRRLPGDDIIIEGIKWRCEDSQTGKVSLHLQHEYNGEEEPLNQRAWALQERLLSPRLLVFGSKQLTWKCLSGYSADGGNSFEMNKEDDFQTLSWALFPQAPALIEESPSAESIDSAWQSIVRNYSHRHMTQESDKLPAISGVAQQIHLVSGDTYLAGLWKAHLRYQLMWFHHTTPSYSYGKRPVSYRAPTWSWASVDGPIQFAGRRHRMFYLSQIVSCNVTLLDKANPFGAVTEGVLVLQGPARTLSAINVREMFRFYPEENSDASKKGSVYLDPLRMGEQLPFLRDNISKSSSSPEELFWFVGMASNMIIHKDHGLVLRATSVDHDSRLPGMFTRVGWFILDERVEFITAYAERWISRKEEKSVNPYDLLHPQVSVETVIIL